MNGLRSLWSLRLLAVLVAIFLWFTISAPEREGVSQTVLNVTVSYTTPRGLVVLDPVEQVRVRLRGPTSRVVDVDASGVEASVDLSGRQVGPVEIQLRPERNFRLPEAVEIAAIEPTVLRLTLDREVTRHVPVTPVFAEPAGSGPQAQERETQEITVTPPTVLARGPESRFGPETRLETAPIRLGPEEGAFSTKVPVVPSEPLIQVLRPRTVTVAARVSRVSSEATPPSPDEASAAAETTAPETDTEASAE